MINVFFLLSNLQCNVCAYIISMYTYCSALLLEFRGHVSGRQMESSEGNPEGAQSSGGGCLSGQRPPGDPQNPGQLAVFQEKVRLAANACAQADFTLAVKLYGEALQIDPRYVQL